MSTFQPLRSRDQVIKYLEQNPEVVRDAHARMEHRPRNPMTMTARMRDLLAFIRDYINEHGIAPSCEEMVEAIGLRSKSGAHRLMVALEERGHIERSFSRARCIRIINPEYQPAQHAAPSRFA
ncbi:hypothetical protein FPY71_07125 [Aureimonas fodinaquatilis]|uniref:LexA repressor DNA-binding domain-containing protein n=1 Tax=Aureimonas fodinaquatilis TaxID=2565783 RepID=A0A5B0DXL4_9HYPH|nr:hypothetical protein [Aureimonas fodinaquatilis]KAA0970290.1 hypothetical protein FPY71_07125 [Aureimonas fodinaquatilis]